ncbi:hypothetical protein PV11_06177 [Exophiala sideris]|uniref:Uncharacterized protein n=1 Tax=Exophiala sideris TaxID=1016849 RepID=A0A0D1WTU4_9EURO|nr:hypothetical protein PV11_06177 [Exophiala sideris]
MRASVALSIRPTPLATFEARVAGCIIPSGDGQLEHLRKRFIVGEWRCLEDTGIADNVPGSCYSNPSTLALDRCCDNYKSFSVPSSCPRRVPPSLLPHRLSRRRLLLVARGRYWASFQKHHPAVLLLRYPRCLRRRPLRLLLCQRIGQRQMEGPLDLHQRPFLVARSPSQNMKIRTPRRLRLLPEVYRRQFRPGAGRNVSLYATQSYWDSCRPQSQVRPSPTLPTGLDFRFSLCLRAIPLPQSGRAAAYPVAGMQFDLRAKRIQMPRTSTNCHGSS